VYLNFVARANYYTGGGLPDLDNWKTNPYMSWGFYGNCTNGTKFAYDPFNSKCVTCPSGCLGCHVELDLALYGNMLTKNKI
jgi:hypothetical protein